MAIKHATTKSPGDKLYAVTDWNSEHLADNVLVPNLNADLLDGKHAGDFISSETDPVWSSEKSNYYTKTETNNTFVTYTGATENVDLGSKSLFANNVYTKTEINNNFVPYTGATNDVDLGSKSIFANNVYTKTEINNNFVPYTGATNDVNLGSKSLSANNMYSGGNSVITTLNAGTGINVEKLNNYTWKITNKCSYYDGGDPTSAHWSKANFNLDNAWHDFYVGNIIPSDAKAAVFNIYIQATAAGQVFEIGPYGTTNGWNRQSAITQAANIWNSVAAIITINNGYIRYHGTTAIGTLYVTVTGYFR